MAEISAALVLALVAVGFSQRAALDLAGVARSTWHYRNQPRARVSEPFAHCQRRIAPERKSNTEPTGRYCSPSINQALSCAGCAWMCDGRGHLCLRGREDGFGQPEHGVQRAIVAVAQPGHPQFDGWSVVGEA